MAAESSPPPTTTGSLVGITSQGLAAANPSASDARATLLVVTIGSRGDVQPYLAICAGFVRAGYRVVLCTHEVFGEAVRECGLEFVGLGGDPQAVMSSEAFTHALYHGSTMDQARVIMTALEEYIDDNYRRLWRAALSHRPDAVIWAMVCYEALSIAQRLRVPSYCLSTIPFKPSSELPPVAGVATPFALGFMNSLMHSLAAQVGWMVVGKRLNAFRQEIGLPPTSYDVRGLPCAGIYSSLLQPNPSDWDAATVTTGFCVVPVADDYQPAQPLADFLAAGEPPIYCGFGSMPIEDRGLYVRLFDAVLQRLGRRGIYCGGWSGIPDDYRSNSRPHLLLIEGCPHEWLFPRCAVVIHHGGAGTTAASCRAGRPTIICPVLGDQPFWAHRLAALGVGPPRPIALRDINSADQLEQLIRAVDTPAAQQAAAQLGTALRAEDGVANLVAWFEQRFASDRGQPGVAIDFDWKSEAAVSHCADCAEAFSVFLWKRHCRSCGNIFCSRCLRRVPFPSYGQPQYCCRSCLQARWPDQPDQSSH